MTMLFTFSIQYFAFHFLVKTKTTCKIPDTSTTYLSIYYEMKRSSNRSFQTINLLCFTFHTILTARLSTCILYPESEHKPVNKGALVVPRKQHRNLHAYLKLRLRALINYIDENNTYFTLTNCILK